MLGFAVERAAALTSAWSGWQTNGASGRLQALNTRQLTISLEPMASATMTSGFACAFGRYTGAARAGARAAAPQWSLQRQGGLREPQQLQQRRWSQQQQRQQAAAAAPGRRSAIVAVAAPVAAGPAAPTSEYAKEMEAAVAAVRLASRLCQASQAEAERGGTPPCRPMPATA